MTKAGSRCGPGGETMNFERHVFISYAHDDNRPIPPEQLGWISRFHAALEAMLTMRLGRKAQIWRDEKLSGNDLFAEEILSQFAKTAILLSVVTPRYVESEWCLREFSEFCKAAEQSGGVALENKARVIKVIKTPVRTDGALPFFAREMLGYEFYTVVDQAPLELDPAYGLDFGQKYNVKLAKLAWDVAQLLERLKASATARPQASESSASSRMPVYLAECSSDRREEREALESELRLHGYQLLPDHQLPMDEDAYVGEVTRLLAQCKLSIHLVGSRYGVVPDGPSQKSVVVLQNELGARASRESGLRRLIWLPDGTIASHPAQEQFIRSLNVEKDAQLGADLITADLETFKGAVHACLSNIEKPATTRSLRTSEKTVYLICDERDREETIRLRRYLKAQGIKVTIPMFDGDAGTVRQANKESLSECEAVVVFYGAGGEAWRRSVESDVKKARGYRGDKPPLVCFTYLSSPATADKKDLIDLEETNVIDALSTFSEAAVKPLVDALG
ncbi:MAG: hypothetical protein C5B57_09385 [Blastocatellia bacterium]|nr:MAG: hypothetical protein C5B57_09385 [Blastocatellia bacterium]